MGDARRCLIWGEGSERPACLGAVTPERPVLPLPNLQYLAPRRGRRPAGAALGSLLLLAGLLCASSVRADEAGDPLRDGPGLPPGAPAIEPSFGTATVAFPIDVPPGRHGLAPALGLRYNSAAADGNAGFGFTLAVGSIERSTHVRPPRFDNTDTFVLILGGESLDLVPVDADSTRFRTVIDSGILIERLTPGPFGPASSYWVARGRDGRRYRFGFQGGAADPSQVQNFKWGLDRIEDTSGNVLEIAWSTAGLLLYPTRITYASHPGRGLPATNSVEFCWETRGDQVLSAAGELMTHRLHEIRTFASARPARSYTLDYSTPGDAANTLGTCYPDSYFLPGASVIDDPMNPPPLSRGRNGSPHMVGATASAAAAGIPAPKTGLPRDPSRLLAIRRGDGSGAFLPRISYTYSGVGSPSWSQNGTGLIPPLPFLYTSSDSDEDSGVRVVDINRDGLPDVLQLEGRQSGSFWIVTSAAYLNTGASFAYSASWSTALRALANHADESRSPYFVVKRSTRDRVENGVRFLDVNDDGYPDIVHLALWYGSGLRKGVFLNTGTGFTPDVAASYGIPDEPFTDIHDDSGRDVAEDRGVRLADINGDGRLDLLVSRAEWGGSTERRVYLYDRAGWRLDTRWILPDDPFVRHIPHGRTLDMGLRILELNGDAYPDLYRAANVNGTVSTAAYINTGRPDGALPTWTRDDSFGTLGVNADYFVQVSSSGDGSSIDHGLRVVDVDGDGRSEVVAGRAWNGGVVEKFLYRPGWSGGWTARVFDELPWLFVVKPAGSGPRDQGVRLLDLNGDGGVDCALSQSSGTRAWRPNGNWRGRVLLTSHSNGIGGTTQIAYVPAPHTGSIDGGGPAALPFPLAVVGEQMLTNALGQSYTTRYTYDGGYYHHAAREFRGFRRAIATEPGGAQSFETVFFQQPALASAPLRGVAAERIVRRAADGAVFSRAVFTYDTSDALPPLRHPPLRSETTLYDYATTDPAAPSYARRSATSWSYVDDDSHGIDRVLLRRTERQEGDVGDPGDDRILTEEFVSTLDAAAGAGGSAAWILEQPWHESVAGVDGRVVAESWTGYDGRAAGQPAMRGLPTRLERRGGPVGSAGDHGPGDADNPAVLRAYDEFGNLASETDPLGRTRRVERGLEDPTYTFPEREVDPLGRAVERAFDPRTGLMTRAIDLNGRTVTIEYDPFGRRVAEWGPDDSAERPTVSYRHDDTMRPVRVHRFARERSGQGERIGTAGCLESTAYFDGMGRLVELATESAAGRIVTRAIAFDAAGRVATEAVPFPAAAGDEFIPPLSAPYRNITTYDTAGRTASRANARGETERFAYHGWTMERTDPLGHRRETGSDAFGQRVLVREYDGTGASLLPAPAALYRHDAGGHLVQTTDPAGSTTVLTYDSLGRRTAIADPHIGSWSYRYDLKGNLSGESDPQQRSTALSYDALDRLMEKILSDGRRFTWRYDEGGAAFDALGRLTSILEPTGSQSFRYDAMGRLISASRDVAGTVYTAGTEYDAMGRMTARLLPAGGRVDYAYDSGGVLISAAPFVAAFEHDERGRTTRLSYPGGTRIERHYDPMTGRPTAVQAFDPGHNVVLDLSYTRDADGLISGVQDRSITGQPIDESYLYDGRHRLVQAIGPYGTRNYAYDDAGTVLLKDGVTYQRDDAARPQRLTGSSAGLSFDYDLLGAAVAQRSATGSRAITYDVTGRMVRLTDTSSGLTITTDYDAEGLPVREISDQPGLHSVVLLPMPEVEVRNGHLLRHIFAEGARIATLAEDGAISIPVTDQLGSPRLVLDGQGRVVGRATYGPYGEPLAGSTPDPVTAFRFAGARRQEGSGLLVMGWRHYDPALGRFLEPDPVVGSPHDPEAFNRYAYARDNPVNITDPDGQSPVVPILFWTAVLLLDRDTRVDVAGSVALTAATIFLTGSLGPGPAAGLLALKASVPALYAAAASTAILRSGMGEAVVSGYAGLLDDLGLSPRASEAAARLTAAWFLNSSLQRGFGALLAANGAARGGDPLGDRSSLDAALARRHVDPDELGSPSSDAYGTTVDDVAGRNGATHELDRFGEVIDGSGNVVGVYGVRDLGPFFDHGAFASIGGNAGPAISNPHYAYALGGISTQQFARDLFASGYSGSLFVLTGRTSDFLIEMAYGPYGGGLALGIGAARGTGAGGDD